MAQHTGQQHEDEIGWYMQGSAREIADVLMEFAQELRGGNVNVWKGQRELHLAPEGKIAFHVEATADDDGREGLQMRLQWYSTSGAADPHSSANMGVELGGTGTKIGDTSEA